MTADEWKNKLYFGDNLDILREHVASESVDMTHVDTPVSSTATRCAQSRKRGVGHA